MSRRGVAITVAGEMDDALRDEFEDVEVTIGRGVTQHLRHADPAALHGLLHRIDAFELELLDVHPATDEDPA